MNAKSGGDRPGGPDESSARSARPDVSPRGHRILVLDDNYDAANVLTRYLQMFGYETRAVFDGQAALAVIPTFRPHAVLLDIGLPGMDGHEVARRIRQELGLKDLLLVAISGYCYEEDLRRSREAGLTHHLAKPVDHQVLLALLAELPDPKPPPAGPQGGTS